MIISVNWLKQYTDIDMPIDELVMLIGSRLVEVEGVEFLGAKYKNVFVVKVVDCEKLEGSDHLNVTKIDDGGAVKDAERDERGLVQVVCGAPNVHAGMTVAWLPPGSTVPESFHKEPFVLEARKLRGVVSNGMLASAKELALYDDHAGILELEPTAVPGTLFADLYGLNDYLLDIENKSLTHRPDTFGIIGFAREVAAIQGKRFESPDWYTNIEPVFGAANNKRPLAVQIDDKELSDRYQAVVMNGVDGTRQSPANIQTYLTRIGMRPISAVVDITNYLMMLTGQPLHAFDYDKLVKVGGGKVDIHVRAAKKGEKLSLLDGRLIELEPQDIIIANGSVPVALAGAMGGGDTEIDDSTKTIMLESATFNLYNLRATQMRHGIFSEAITRFTKGQPAELTAPVLTEAASLLVKYAGAAVASDMAEDYPGNRPTKAVEVNCDGLNALLGSDFSAGQVVKTLEDVEFSLVNTGTSLKVTPPFWRADIHISQDVAEEVGRLNGYDEIPLAVPRRDFVAVKPTDYDMFKQELRTLLVRAGANEVLTYSFVHGDLLQKAFQKPSNSYRLVNSLSPDLQYYRQSLSPSLLNLVSPNLKAGFDTFALFEMNKAHHKAHGLDTEKIPGELSMLALTIVSKKPYKGAPYYHARRYLDYIAHALGLVLSYAPIENDLSYPVMAPFDHQRSAIVSDMKSGELIGVVGEYRKLVAKAFKLPAYCSGFEIDSEALLKAARGKQSSYSPPSRYPSTERDVCFQVGYETTYDSLVSAIDIALRGINLLITVEPIDIYRADETKKNLTFRFVITSYDKTLTGKEIDKTIDEIAQYVIKKCQATVI